MPALDQDTIAKLYAALATVLAALIAGLLAWYSGLKIKQFELRAQERKEKAAQRLALYVPLLRFCYELDGRIGRILSMLHTDWLRSTYLDKIRGNEGFAKSPRETGYFIMSNVYLFACFFGWTEAIKKGIDTTAPLSERSRARRWLLGQIGVVRERLFGPPAQSRIFFFDHDISVVRRLFQYEELFRKYVTSKKLVEPRDACKLHRHFQHSIGEMMLQPDGQTIRCKTFREFYESYRDIERFRYWFEPLEDLFRDLSDFPRDKDIETQAEMKNDIRPLRLLAIRYWCRVLMKDLAKDLGIETPPPEEVLKGRSETLRTTITSVRIEELEPYLAGIPFSQ